MSRRLVLLNAGLRHLGRPLLRRTKTPQRARRDFELTSRLIFRGPKSDAMACSVGGVPGLDVRPKGSKTDAVVLYFHGGGYITGSARSHLPMVGHLARRAGVRIVIPDYRLAPEAAFPAAFDDAMSAWRGLRDAGVTADRIVLGGDSAGGGLALSLLGALLQQGERPGGLFALSPWTDLSLSGASLAENAARDAILPVERMTELCGLIAPDCDPADPRLSPLFAGFRGSPSIYLQASESEILRDDTLRLAERMKAEQVDVRVDTWPDAPHVWQIFRGWLPEADDALDRVAGFVHACLRSSSRPSGS